MAPLGHAAAPPPVRGLVVRGVLGALAWWLAAALLWVIGEQAAGRHCLEGLDLPLTPGAAPESEGVRVGAGERCIVHAGARVVRVLDMDDWDLTEAALSVAALGVVVLAVVVFLAHRRQSAGRS